MAYWADGRVLTQHMLILRFIMSAELWLVAVSVEFCFGSVCHVHVRTVRYSFAIPADHCNRFRVRDTQVVSPCHFPVGSRRGLAIERWLKQSPVAWPAIVRWLKFLLLTAHRNMST